MSIYVPLNTENLQGLKGKSDNLDAGCEGVQVYIRTEDIPLYLESQKVSADTSTISASAKPGLKLGGRVKKSEDPNYIRNQGTGEEVGGIDDSNQLDQLEEEIKNLEDELNSIENNINENDYYTTDENGYLIPNAEALEKLFRQILNLVYKLQALMMAFDGVYNLVSISTQLLFQARNRGSAVMSSGSSIVENHATNINTFSNQLFATCLEYNQNLYQQQYNKADEKNDGFWSGVWDWLSGGDQSIKVVQARIEATEKYQQSVQKIIDAMTKVLSSLGPEAAKAAANFESLFVTRSNGYLDLNINAILDLRQQITDAIDVQQAYYNAAMGQSDLLSIANQILNEVRTGNSGRQLVLKLHDEIKSHVGSVFDQLSNAYFLKKQLHNQKVFDEDILDTMYKAKPLKMFISQLTIGLAVFALIVAVFVPAASVGVCAIIIIIGGLVSAGLNWLGAKLTDSLTDFYDPADQMGSFELVTDVQQETGDQIVDLLVALDQQEKRALNRPNKGMLVNLGDGYKAIDFKALLDIADEREAIQLVRDLLIKIKLEIDDLPLLGAKIMTGFEVSSGIRQVVSNITQSDEANKDLDIEAAKYLLNDFKNAANQKRAAEIAMNNATTSFFLNTITSVASGLLSMGIGQSAAYFAIGFGVGSALGSALAEIINSKTSVDTFYEQENEVLEDLKNSAKENSDDLYDNTQNLILADLIEKTRVDIGRGRQEVSSQKVIELQRLLGSMEAVRSIMIDLNIAKDEVARNYAYSEAGVSAPRDDLGNKISARTSQTLSKKIGYAVAISRESLEVSNRAAKAREAYENAGTNMIINIAVAAISVILGGSLSNVSTLTGTGLMLAKLGQTILRLTSSFMGVITGIYNIVYNAQRSSDDYGDLMADYELAQKLRQKQTGDGTADTANVDVLEARIIEEATKKLFSRYGLNSGFFGNFQGKLDRLYQLRETLLKARDMEVELALKAASEFNDYYNATPSMMQKVNSQQRTLSFAAIENILNGLRAMAERYNEIDESKLQMIQSIISTSISVIDSALSAVNTAKGEEAHQLRQIKTKLTADQARRLNNLNQSQKFWKAMSLSMTIIKILNSFTALVVKAIYRSQQRDDYGDDPARLPAPGKETSGVGASLSRLEQIKVDKQMESGLSTLKRQATLEWFELMQSVMNALRLAIENITNAVKEEETERERETGNKWANRKPQLRANPAPKMENEKETKAAPMITPTPPPQAMAPFSAVRAAKEEQDRYFERSSETRPTTISSC